MKFLSVFLILFVPVNAFASWKGWMFAGVAMEGVALLMSVHSQDFTDQAHDSQREEINQLNLYSNNLINSQVYQGMANRELANKGNTHAYKYYLGQVDYYQRLADINTKNYLTFRSQSDNYSKEESQWRTASYSVAGIGLICIGKSIWSYMYPKPKGHGKQSEGIKLALNKQLNGLQLVYRY